VNWMAKGERADLDSALFLSLERGRAGPLLAAQRCLKSAILILPTSLKKLLVIISWDHCDIEVAQPQPRSSAQ